MCNFLSYVPDVTVSLLILKVIGQRKQENIFGQKSLQLEK